jgi:hypothetical protein
MKERPHDLDVPAATRIARLGLALFRLVNGNALRASWFWTVAGKPHIPNHAVLHDASNFNNLAGGHCG